MTAVQQACPASPLERIALDMWPFRHPDVPAEWNREPMQVGTEDGIVWVIARAPLYGITGYAFIPAEGHRWSAGFGETDEYGQHEAERTIRVHGGVTYADLPWIGFDTNHSGDIWQPEYSDPVMETSAKLARMVPWCIEWTVDRAREEARSLARQVAAVGVDA